jgi:hypothetical protein
MCGGKRAERHVEWASKSRHRRALHGAELIWPVGRLWWDVRGAPLVRFIGETAASWGSGEHMG